MSRRVLFLSATLGLLLAGSLASVPTALGGGGCHAELTGDSHGDGATSVVRMDVCSFEPTVARVPVGAEVTFLNTAGFDHVVLGRGQTWGRGDNLRPGESLVQRFGEAGVFPYSCPLHPGMVGAIVVGDANTPPAAMGATVDEAGAPAAAIEAAAADDATPGEGAPTAAGPMDPIAVVGLGGLAGAAVLALGLGVLAVRRRPGTDPAAG
jgi:plastocyanin